MNVRGVWSWGTGIGLLLAIVALFWITAISASAQTATPVATRTPRATATRTVTATETLTATEEMTGTEAVTATEAATLTGDALLAQEMDAMLTDMADAGRYSGSVLVARDGVPILSKGYGMANAEWDIPNSPTTRFRIAHLTMVFTALAILQLQEQGLLDVQDSVCDYLDPCPEPWQPITLHDLLIHTSGVPDYTGLADYEDWKRNPTTPDELIGRVADLPLEVEPGGEQRYSLTNYVILGRIVENVADTPLARYLREEIFQPLGMSNSSLDVQGLLVPQRASGHEIGGFGADYVDPSVLGAARGMYSTTEDLLRFNEALYSGDLLPLDALEPMLTPQIDVPGTLWENLRGGYGWFFQTLDDREMVFHGGPVEGFYVAMNYVPDERITVIALNNREDVGGYGTADTLTQMVFDSE